MYLLFPIKYDRTVFTNKVSEMGESFCRKLSEARNFPNQNVSETCEPAFRFRSACSRWGLLSRAVSQYSTKTGWLLGLDENSLRLVVVAITGHCEIRSLKRI